MRRRVRNNGFCTNVVASCGSSSRAGLRRPRLRPASVPRRLRPNLKPFVILNEVDRRTQREQRPLADYAEQGGERQTQCSQESVYVYLIQILRRSAPQNDKLLNCSQTPRQTGICNWRQRGKVERKRCSGRSRLAEINTGFSRASRSPALRRLAKLAPRTSARKQHSADRSRACELTTYALSERSERSLRSSESGDSRSGELPRREAAARATLRITKPQNEKKRRSNNRPQTTIPYQSFCTITPPADC